MKKLWLLRHAKSSWSDSTLDDHQRPLNDRGRKAALAVGAFMKQTSLSPDLILCSSALRTRQTLEILSEAAELASEVQYRQSLYLSDRQGLINQITALEDTLSAVMIIGHNPGMEEILAYLVGLERRMPTAALAQIEMEIKSWRDVRKRENNLRWLITPKDLRD